MHRENTAYEGAQRHYVTKSAEFSALRDEYAALTSALSGLGGGHAAAQILDLFSARKAKTLTRAEGEVHAAFEATWKAFNVVDNAFTEWRKKGLTGAWRRRRACRTCSTRAAMHWWKSVAISWLDLQRLMTRRPRSGLSLSARRLLRPPMC